MSKIEDSFFRNLGMISSNCPYEADVERGKVAALLTIAEKLEEMTYEMKIIEDCLRRIDVSVRLGCYH